MQVSQYWRSGHNYDAKLASIKAKDLATASLVCGGINTLIYFVIALTSTLTALGVLDYFNRKVHA